MARCLGAGDVADALRKAGATVQVHEGNFASDAPDEVWLTEVDRRGWVVLLKDDRIRYRFTEKQALARARVRAFFLASKKLSGPENGAIFAKAHERIQRFSRGNQPPFIAKVFRNGTVKLWERPRIY